MDAVTKVPDRQALERERSIRDFCADVGPFPKFRTVLVQDASGGVVFLRPAGTEVLDKSGLALGTIDEGVLADKVGDSVLVYVRVKELPKELFVVKSVQASVLTRAGVRALSPVYSSLSDADLNAKTHRSYAFPTVLQEYLFGGTYNPLSVNPAFPNLSGDRLKESGGNANFQTGVLGGALYKWATTAQPPNDGGCSLTIHAQEGWSTGSWAGVVFRCSDSTHYYSLRKNYSNLLLYVCNGGAEVLLGSYSAPGVLWTYVRLEASGTTITGFIGGDTVRISVTNSLLTSGWCGLHLSQGDTRDYPYGDNIRLLAVPVAPTNVAATDDLTDKVRVTWDAPAWADTYKVYRDGGLLQAGIAALLWDDTTAVAGVTYSYTVVTTAGGADSVASAADNGTRLAAGNPWYLEQAKRRNR